jgi:hypothetical protein
VACSSSYQGPLNPRHLALHYIPSFPLPPVPTLDYHGQHEQIYDSIDLLPPVLVVVSKMLYLLLSQCCLEIV